MTEDAPPRDQARAPTRPTFDEAYRDGAADVLRALRRYGVDDRDCEDAMHEVFVVVLRRLPEYEPRRPLVAWLRAIARLIAMQRRQKQRRTPLLADLPGLEKEVAKMDHENNLDQERRAILRELLLRLLDSLEPDRRAIFVMYELDGMTAPEIADELSLPVGTVSTRLRLARADIEVALARLKASQRGGAALASLTIAMLLLVEREMPPLPPGMSDRVLARLRAAPPGPGPGASPESGPVRDVAAGALKHGAVLLSRSAAGAGGALLFAAGVAVGALWQPLHPSPSSPAAPSTAVAPAPEETTSPAPAAAASGSADVALDAGPAPKGAPDDEADERALMRKASGALASGDAASALAAVEEHARRYHGGGRHAEERESYRILALASAGRGAEARDRFERFAQTYPTSTRLDALRAAVGDGGAPR